MEEILSGVKNIYLVGIGGVGMSGLAMLLKDKGFNVKGSDIKKSQYTLMLEDAGIEVLDGHKSQNLSPDTDILAYSSAVDSDNPEILEAKKKGICILKRGQLLAKLCLGKKTIAVAGSHGKTTTSSLIGHLLSSLGYDPTVFLGGLPLNYSRGAWWGKGYFVAETDESDASFLFYEPWVSIITNIDHEHIDHYGSFQNLEEKFLQFALKTSGKVIGWGDQSQVSKIISKTGGLSFGWSKGNLVRGEGFYFDGKCSCFNLYLEDQFFMPVKVPLLGEHNCLNVLAAFAVFLYLGEDLKKVNRMLETFQGSRRRFQVKDKCQRVVFVDDYAHHPTEIKAVIKAARLLKPKRLFLVLQPHRFSRVQMLKDSFYDCILGADRVVVTDIYSAQEKNISGLKSQDLLEGMKRNFFGRIDYIPQDKLAQDLPFLIEEGDLVLALGAGNINTIMQEVVDVFKKNRIKA